MTKNEHNIEIIEYSDEHCEPIKKLNYERLEKYFYFEEGDIVSLSNPRKYITEKGRYIYYSKLNSEIVGTVSLLRKSETIYEVGKILPNKNKYQRLFYTPIQFYNQRFTYIENTALKKLN